MANKASLDELFFRGHNSKQQTRAAKNKKKREKGRRFANVRLLITHPCTAHVCICMHFPRKPLYYHKSFSGGEAGPPLHVSTPVLLFLAQADLWIDSNLASLVLSQSTKRSISHGSGTFLLIRPFTTQRRLASLCRLMKRMWIGSVNLILINTRSTNITEKEFFHVAL